MAKHAMDSIGLDILTYENREIVKPYVIRSPNSNYISFLLDNIK